MSDREALGQWRKDRRDACLTEHVDGRVPVAKLVKFIDDLRALYLEERSAYETYYKAWSDQCTENDRLLNDLRSCGRELEQTKNELEHVKEALRDTTNENTELRATLEEFSDTKQKLEDTLEGTRTRAKDYEQKMDEYAQGLETDIENLEEENKKLQLDKQELEDKIRKCVSQEESEKLRADKEHLVNQLALLKKDHEEKKRELDEQTGLLLELQRKFDELEKSVEYKEKPTEREDDAELKTRLDQMELKIEELEKVQEENKSLKAERELLRDDDTCEMTRIFQKEKMFIDWASGCEADLQSAIAAKNYANDPAARKAYIQSQMLRYVGVHRLMEDLKTKEEEIETLKLKLTAAQTRAELDSPNKGSGGQSGSGDTSDQVRLLEAELKKTQLMNHRLHARCALWFNGVKGDMQTIHNLIETTLDRMIAMRQERDVSDRISPAHPMMQFFQQVADLKKGLSGAQK